MDYSIKISPLDNKDILVEIPKNFRNKSWSECAFVFQTIMKTKEFENEKIQKIHFDFSKTEWADPLPLLAMLVNIKQSSNFSSNEISFRLPNLDEVSLFLDSRFLKFITEEGFIENFKSIGIIENELTDKNYVTKLGANTATLIFSDCSLLKSTILDLVPYEKQEDFDSLLKRMLKEIETNLNTKGINAFYLNNLSYKIKSFLTETIDNVRTHAYEENKEKTIGFYVRYRNGLANKSLDYDTLKILDKVLSDEENYCPKLHREYLDIKEGCVEIFVIDAGKGISESFGNRTSKVKWPLRTTTKEIFNYGRRGKNNKTIGRSDKGGLFLLGKIIELDNDYLNLLDCNEYVGAFLPFKYHNNEYLEAKTGGYIKGTHWIGRLSWKTKPEDEISHWYFIRNKDVTIDSKHLECFTSQEYKSQLNEILKKSFHYSSDYNAKYHIIDKRDFRLNTTIDTIKELDKDVIFLPESNFTKNVLINTIFFKLINQNTVIKDKKKLIIADIPDDERVLYFESFNNLTIFNQAHFKKIILITRRQRICVFELKNKVYINISKNRINDYFKLDGVCNLYEIHSILKSYDSDLFWKRVDNLNVNKGVFIEELVKWNNELKNISGYLNYSEVLTDRFVEELFLNSLERVLGFMPSKECSFSNMDILTKQITNHANAIFIPYRKGEKDFQINVGSIFVTGQNEKNALWGFDDNEESFNIHFFVHFQSLSKPVCIYDWGKEKLYVKGEPQYERIGRSHVISRGGYKAIKIPRYDRNGFSVYYRNPVKTYEDWQNTKLSYLKIGNYEYENNFDLFKIDVFKALKHTFHYCDELAEFLVSHFFISLGGNTKVQLSKLEYWQKIESVLSDPKGEIDIQNFRTNDFCKNTCLIIYPYHPNTSYAIKKIKECLSEEFYDRIIQLTPIKTNHSGSSFLFSPEAFKKIRNIIQSAPINKREVIFFDDSIVSGRTRKEVKHILLNLNVTKVKTLALLDRFRLPYTHQSTDTNRYYWRFDVPRLGVKNINPITRALNIAHSFALNLNEISRKRIKQWQKAWGVTSIYLDSPMVGISSSQIKLKEPYKSFGLKWNAKKRDFLQISEKDNAPNKNKIKLINSFGLTINTTEIHTLTGQDSRAYLFATNEKGYLSNGAKIELLSTQLLLFPKEFPKENHFNMIKILYDTLEEYQINNNHTVLAALTLIIQDDIYIKKLIEYVQRKHYACSYMDCKNVDLRIILSYFVQKYQINNPIFNFISNCIISNSSLLNIYNRIHFELFQEREIHYSPLIVLYKKRDKPLFYRLDNALHSLLNIKECITYLQEVSSYRSYYTNGSIEDCINEYIEMIDSLLRKYERSINFTGNIEKDDEKLIQKLIQEIEKDIVNPLIKVHESIFFKLSTSTEKKPNFIKDLNNIKSSITETDWLNDANRKKELVNQMFLDIAPNISFSETAYETITKLSSVQNNIWIIYDYHTRIYIRDIIANAIYASKTIDNSDSHCIIDLNILSEDFLRISFLNYTQNSNADKDSDKMTLLREHFESIGGKYSNSLNNGLLQVNIDIPII